MMTITDHTTRPTPVRKTSLGDVKFGTVFRGSLQPALGQHAISGVWVLTSLGPTLIKGATLDARPFSISHQTFACVVEGYEELNDTELIIRG